MEFDGHESTAQCAVAVILYNQNGTINSNNAGRNKIGAPKSVEQSIKMVNSERVEAECPLSSHVVGDADGEGYP